MDGFFVCRICACRFVSLRSARIHLRSCAGGVIDLSSDIQYIEGEKQ